MCLRIASWKARCAAARRRRVARRDRAQQLVALERELGVDGDRARRVGQLQQAVDARAGRQRALELVGRRRQRIRHQVVQLHLAEGAARLLVGQDLLQADHLGRELADLLLRLVDPGQPLAQVGDDLAGRLLAAVQPLVTRPWRAPAPARAANARPAARCRPAPALARPLPAVAAAQHGDQPGRRRGPRSPRAGSRPGDPLPAFIGGLDKRTTDR